MALKCILNFIYFIYFILNYILTNIFIFKSHLIFEIFTCLNLSYTTLIYNFIGMGESLCIVMKRLILFQISNKYSARLNNNFLTIKVEKKK